MSLGGYLFGELGYLGGHAIRKGRRPGKWRPGHRTTELKIAAAKRKLKAFGKGNTRADKQKAGAIKRGLPTAPAGRRVALTPAQARQALTPAPPTRKAVTLPAPATSKASVLRSAAKRGLLAGIASALGAACCDGLGDALDILASDDSGDTTDTNPATADTTYTPNAAVWVSIETVPFYWQMPIAPGWPRQRYNTRPRQGGNDGKDASGQRAVGLAALAPALYPDGTPITGHVWLPKLDLTQLDGELYAPWWRIATAGSGAHPEQKTGRDDVITVDDPAYEGYVYYGINTQGARGEASRFPASGGPVANPSHHSYYDWGALRTRTWDQWDIQNSFDWSTSPPSVQAYPWLWDNLTPAKLVGWVEQPADLWRSDGKDISAGGRLQLAGAPWLFHCLEFLDALAIGAHGLPQVITAEGIFDQPAFAAWAATHAPYDELLHVWDGGPFALATVYDNKPVTLAPKQAPPPVVPADVAPAPDDAGYVDDSGGYVDDASGYVDDSGGAPLVLQAPGVDAGGGGGGAQLIVADEQPYDVAYLPNQATPFDEFPEDMPDDGAMLMPGEPLVDELLDPMAAMMQLQNDSAPLELSDDDILYLYELGLVDIDAAGNVSFLDGGEGDDQPQPGTLTLEGLELQEDFRR